MSVAALAACGTLCGGRPVPLVGKKMAQCDEKKRTELPLLRCHASEGLAGQKAGEKLLGQVLRIHWAVTLAPDVGIKGIPVSATEPFQCRGRFGSLFIRRSQDNAPMSGGKYG